jgi:NCAIR mutase (PurE)-related protein
VERDAIRKLLEQVRLGEADVDQAMQRLKLDPIDRLGFAEVDLHRAIRRGYPEAIYGPGKSADEIVAIAGRLIQAEQSVIVTRVEPDIAAHVKKAMHDAQYHERARMLTVRVAQPEEPRPGVTVISAGTSDRAVADEAILTAEMMGNAVRSIFDVGVAGLHRLLAHREALAEARVLIVVAGMEGALASVVSGMVDCPVIGVPTSIGYGAGAGGQAALLAMLNSCASGLTVVNIDNGFGAGYAASTINAAITQDRPQKSETRADR